MKSTCKAMIEDQWMNSLVFIESYYMEDCLCLLFQHTQLIERQLYQRAFTHVLFGWLKSSVESLSQLTKEQFESVEKPSS